jgi:hypothetical protein
LIVGAFACWWLYLPITYGTPLAPETLKRRMLPWWTHSGQVWVNHPPVLSMTPSVQIPRRSAYPHKYDKTMFMS